MTHIIYNNNYLDEKDTKLVLFDNGQSPSDTVYSDRLFQWDHIKHDKLCNKYFGNSGQYWSNRSPENIEKFLRDYIGDNSIILCKIEQTQHNITGYPIWRFDLKRKIKTYDTK